ncbi:MAG: hypothetical protein CL799_11475 [Chromatiales bacterium]|nr:hypothetical protein [Chromatiales bacterium]
MRSLIRNSVAALFPCMCALAFSGCSVLDTAPEVEIDVGRVHGSLMDGVQSYKGIPFVAPPVGELRWQPPQPIEPWEGVLQATEYSPFCPQNDDKYLWFELTEISEDCLSLNVLTTAANTEAKLPVMVWIHGGGYVNGSGNIPRLNSTAIPKQGVVLVTINYRLTLLGFMTHPALATGDPDQPQGNYGILDIIESLKWVQRNISAFGGDPDNVTIFGESAGAGFVNFLMVSPKSEGLFHRAISESSSVGVAPDPYIDRRAGFLPAANSVGMAFAERLGIDNHDRSSPEVAAALRAVSIEKILATLEPQDRFTPVVEGVVLPDQVGELLATGRQKKVPYMTGGNNWEASLGRAIGGGFSPEFAGKLVPKADKERLYAGLSGEALDDQIFGDLIVHSGSRYFAERMFKRGAPVYRYYLTYLAEARRDTQPGVAHTDDIAFVMQTLHEEDLNIITSRDWEISRLMGAYWVQFAKTGNPNRGDLPEWPAFDDQKGSVLEIGDEIRPLEYPLEDRVQFHMNRGLGLMQKARK